MELRLPLELFMGFQAPCQTVCGICRFFQTMHGGVSDPSFCVFIHRVAFEEVSGHRVLMKADWEIGVVQHLAPPTWLVSNFLMKPASS